jgi:hypothetical protein
VSYRDNGANGVPSALGEAVLTVNPKLLQAEHNDASSGVTRTADDTASGKFKITSFDAGDWIAYDPVDFTGIDAVETRVAGAGTLSLRWNSPTAKPFATATVSSGSGWRTVTTDLDDAPSGTGRLYVTSTGGLDVDSFTFQGEGIADATPPTATLTLNPAEPNGKRGWYNTNVTVRVDASDDGVVASRQYSLDGGATWVNVPNNGLVLSADGETQVRYRALDSGGNLSAVGRAKVKIDKTAPVLSVSGVEARQYGIAETITPVFTSADATSGVATLKGEIDGDKIASGAPIPLSRLGAGEHALTVTTTDRAGHAVTRTVTFTVVA